MEWQFLEGVMLKRAAWLGTAVVALSFSSPVEAQRCPQVGCGAPADQPFVVSVLPQGWEGRDVFLAAYEQDEPVTPDARFVSLSYRSAEELDSVISMLVANPNLGGLVVVGDWAAVTRYTEQVFSSRFPAAIVPVAGEDLVLNLQGSANSESRPNQTDVSVVGAFVRDSLIEWWGVRKGFFVTQR